MFELRNPFIFAPIKLGYTNGDGYVNDRHTAFYAARSKYLGAVTIEPLYLDKGLREIPTQLGIDDDEKIEGLRELVETVHRSGAKAIAHLNHPGRMANPGILGNHFVSSTDKPCENGGAVPKRMDREDMNNAIDLFTAAAARAKEANFDIMELQFGHGYLMAQFISPLVNDRTDEFGGSFENRIRFPLEVLRAVRKTVDLPVIVRISGDEMLPDGIKLPEMIEFSGILERNGAAAVHVSAGSVCSTPPWFFQHMFIPKGKTWSMAGEIRKNVGIPVIAVGKINEFADIDRIRNEGLADIIAVGRPLVADPDFIGKYLGRVEGEAAPCLACTSGCLGGVKSGQGLKCLVNPVVGGEGDSREKAGIGRRFAVIGGGLAGMEAALGLKDRGHKVVLFERDRLGGQFDLAHLAPGKGSMKRLLDYYKRRIEKEGIAVELREPELEELGRTYDGVVVATGSRPSIPPIPGLSSVEHHWAEILREENMPEDKNVLIIGGGLIGVDIATALVMNGNRVIIVKRTEDFGEDMEMITKALSLKMMREGNVVFSDRTNISRIDGRTTYAERNGENIVFENIDTYIVSTGMESYDPYSSALGNIVPTYVIGDAKQPGKADDAISMAHELAGSL